MLDTASKRCRGLKLWRGLEMNVQRRCKHARRATVASDENWGLLAGMLT